MTHEDFPDRQQIEAALRRVQSGELSPTVATELLLANFPPPSASTHREADAVKDFGDESLASLIDRLGTPPADVVDVWCEQITSAAITHEEMSGQALPAIDLHEWAINAAGELLWRPQSFARRRGTVTQTPALKTPSREQIDRFRRSLFADETAPSDAESSAALQTKADPIVTTGVPVDVETPTATGATVESPLGPLARDLMSRREIRNRGSRHLLIGGVAMVCLAAIVAILIQALGTNTRLASKPAGAVTFASDRITEVDPADSGQRGADPPNLADRSLDVVVELETFVSPGEVDSASIDQPDAWLSQDALVPVSDFLTPSTELERSIDQAEPGSAPADPPAAGQIISVSAAASDVNAPNGRVRYADT